MKETEIIVPIFNYQILLIYGKHEDISPYLKEKHKGLDVSEYVSTQGNHFKVVDNNVRKSYDYLVIYEGCDDTTIYHESLHIAWEILNERLIKVDYDNQEVLAYLTDYISTEVFNILNN
jgi:hypothetical protein